MNIDIDKYYSDRGFVVGKKNNKCPFHDDKTPSMSINPSGLFYCFSCSEGGNLLQFEAKLKNIDTKEAYKNLCQEYNIEEVKALKQEVVDGYHNSLLRDNKILDYLKMERGIGIDIVKKYQLGLDKRRLAIPIYKHGFCINIRFKEGKDVSGIKDHNKAELYPYDNLKEDKIYIMEGEMDCLLANQLGLNAITVTGAALVWEKEFTPYFTNKEVIIVGDIDKPGIDGALNKIKHIRKVSSNIKNIILPINSPANGDFTDYIITHGFTIDDFHKLVEQTKLVDEAKAEPESEKVNLGDSSNAIYYGKYLETAVTIIGKDDDAFNIPFKYKYICNGNGGKKCFYCPLRESKESEFTVDLKSEKVLGLINVSNVQRNLALKRIAGINCENATLDILEKSNVQEVIAIPEISYKVDFSSEYINRRLYYSGHGLKANKSYILKGYNYTLPSTQYSTMLIDKAIATQGTLDPSLITDEIKNKFKIFQCESTVEAVEAKLKDKYDDFSANLNPHIYLRNDMRFGIDLVFHSVLKFKFCGSYTEKGWIDGLIVGDTQCGKSKCIEGVVEHYKAGEIIGGDNVSLAGLIGGCQQIGKGWNITWGKLPINDCRLVAIDEKIGNEIMELLSGIRSKGVAEIDKIRKGKTLARTRFLYLANPTRKLGTYSKGVIAVKELIKKTEDISRFDFALTVADTDITPEEINKHMLETKEHKYTSDACHWLVMWAWTRRPENIEITKKAEQAILDLSLMLTKEYDSSIPLVTPAAQNIKMARMSIALACMLYSTDETGEKVIVKPEFVEVIYRFLHNVYNKPSMGYDLYSEFNNKSDNWITDNWDNLIREFKQLKDDVTLKDLLLQYEIVNKSELQLHMGYEDNESKAFFNWASKNHLMYSTHKGYAKHRKFIEMLKQINKEGSKKNEQQDIL